MGKKIKDNLFLLLIATPSSLLVSLYLFIKKDFPYLSLISLIILIFLMFRLLKVTQRNILEYLNGPKRFCKGKGIEIGSGGQHMVKGSMLVDIIDNFSNKKSYKVDYITDAHELPKIKDKSLDYVCASNVLEHLTNPVKAILEWFRVLKPNGIIWLRIPDKRKTFDKSRERTKLSHLIEDFKKNIPVNDTTHIEDHNKNSSPPRQEMHPYIHNHVWIPGDIVELFDYIHKNHIPLKIIRYNENTCKNAQDFWIIIQKSGKK